MAANGFLREGGGRGGKATATLAVQPGATYQINVGGRGELRNFVAGGGGAGGFNGGASGSAGFDSTGGGGASDIRTGSFSLAERAIVAGGGGGIGGSCGSVFGGDGGGGGGVSGAAGFPSFAGAAEAVGGGGTQTDGGSGGAYLNAVPASDLAQAGSFGFGGTGARLSSTVGGGGGGGYYGGGGGGISPGCPAAGGGGGGSGYGPTGVIFASGVRAGDGLVILTYTPDTTAPVILSTIDGVSGSNGWYTGDVSVSWSVSDAKSSISAQTGCDPSSVNSDTGGVTFTCAATSAGGSASQSVTVKRDATPPALAPAVSPNPVLLNDAASVTANASDTLSGLASQSCGTLDTSSIGSKSVTCTASDNAGNTASVVASYQVIYPWSGFSSPVDNLPTVNTASAGRGIPLKWRITDASGNPITNLASVSVTSAAGGCSAGAPADGAGGVRHNHLGPAEPG